MHCRGIDLRQREPPIAVGISGGRHHHARKVCHVIIRIKPDGAQHAHQLVHIERLVAVLVELRQLGRADDVVAIAVK